MKRAQHRYHSCMNNCMEEREGKGKVHVVSDTVILKKKCLNENLDLVFLRFHI